MKDMIESGAREALKGELLLYITPPERHDAIDRYFDLGASRTVCSARRRGRGIAKEKTPPRYGRSRARARGSFSISRSGRSRPVRPSSSTTAISSSAAGRSSVSENSIDVFTQTYARSDLFPDGPGGPAGALFLFSCLSSAFPVYWLHDKP